MDTAGRREFLKQAVAGLGLIGVLREQSDRHLGFDLSAAGLQSGLIKTPQSMAQAGEAFLNSLSAGQRTAAILPFQSRQRQEFHYTPDPHVGITYKQLDQKQRQLADALLRVGLSQRGFVKAATVISLEPILREEERGQGPERDPELYYYALFGEPGSSKPWGWRFEGHHISLNFTLVDDEHIASTPSFFGAHPAEVEHGPRKGVRALAGEEDLSKMLLKSLDQQQRAQAVISKSAPSDILSGHSRKADPIKPVGLQASRMSGMQGEILMNLLMEYAGSMSSDIATARIANLRAAGFGDIYFAWAGGTERSQGHYYRIQGPSFLLEYDNVQDDANHIHSVWRDFKNDFGMDLLAEHYKNAHS